MNAAHAGEGLSLVVAVSFYGGFIISLGILIYTFILAKRIRFSGALYKTILFTGLGIFVFGIHHLGEVILEGIPYGLEISESIEGVGVILLFLATYNLYKIAKGVKQ